MTHQRALKSAIHLLLVCAVSILCFACADRLSKTNQAAQSNTSEQTYQLNQTPQQAQQLAQWQREAPLPKGFNEPRAVGSPYLEMLPAYRAVQAQSFSDCFQHIKQNKIPMTAPVVMTMDDDGRGNLMGMEHMRFLFPTPETDSIDQTDSTKIVDVPEQLVVSIYMMGAMSDDRIELALNKIRDWASRQAELIQEVGPVTIVGFNSPFVLPWKKMWGVQIPIDYSVNLNQTVIY